MAVTNWLLRSLATRQASAQPCPSPLRNDNFKVARLRKRASIHGTRSEQVTVKSKAGRSSGTYAYTWHGGTWQAEG